MAGIGIVAILAGCSVLLAILLILIVLPIWIVFHYLSKSRMSSGLAARDEKMLTDLWEAARRMEARLANLERALGPDPSGKNR